MVKQEAERDHNIGQTEQNGHPTPEDVFEAFKIFGEQFQKIKESKNPKLLSIEGSINDECTLPDGRQTHITWTRYRKTSSCLKLLGDITQNGEDLRQQGIRLVTYDFGQEFNKTESFPYIIKSTLRTGEKEHKHKQLNAQDGKELSEVNALIKELSNKFFPLSEKNKVVSTGKETKGPKKNILGSLKQIFTGK